MIALMLSVAAIMLLGIALFCQGWVYVIDAESNETEGIELALSGIFLVALAAAILNFIYTTGG